MWRERRGGVYKEWGIMRVDWNFVTSAELIKGRVTDFDDQNVVAIVRSGGEVVRTWGKAMGRE